MLIGAQHVGGSDARVLLGQAPVLDALRLAAQERGDIANCPQPVANTQAGVDSQ
jgi:hypothetical protein